MTWALYLRQSLDPTGQQAGVSRQRDEGTALLLSRSLDWLEYVDNDTSAYNLRKPRPQYRAMLAAVEAGEVEGIVCWHPDRLYRRIEDLTELIDLCNKHAVSIETVRGGEIDLSTPMGRLVARTMAVFSMGEMEQKSDRQKAAHRQRYKDGRHFWTRRPFGYVKTLDAHGRHGGAELHPTEAPLVREAYEKVLAGVSIHSIMRDWNKAGIETSAGKSWRTNQLRQILTNPRNAGLIGRWEGQEIVLMGKGAWPAIVSEDTWRATVALVSDPARNTYAKNGAKVRKHLLVGIAKCQCGESVRSAQTARARKPGYTCLACHGFCRESEFIDNKLIEFIAARLAMEDAKQLFQRKDIDLGAIAARRAELNAQMEEAEDEHEHGFITGRQLFRRTEHLAGELAELTRRETDALRAKIYAGVIGADDTEKAFRERPLDQQRAIIADMVSVTIKPGRRGKKLTDTTFDEIVKLAWKTPN